MRANVWLRCLREAPEAESRLVVFPHAGGAASYFFPLSRALSPKIEVFAVQYPGRQDRRREKTFEDVVPLAERLVEQLRPVDDHRPVVYFGHSLGATVAFEVARRLEAEGNGPRALIASARCAPSAHRSHEIHLLDDAGIVAELRKLSGTADRLLDDEELLETLMPAIRGDYKAAETYSYTPGPPLNCPVFGFYGDDDVRVGEEDLLGWKAHTVGGFELHGLPGGHFYPSENPTRTAEEIEARVGSVM
ncbi:thioesterase II family protein [Nocardiopsis alba]|jgi:pyochelin biosynthetic protein PchC|uniref:thioesterase II family protein n=1 Tax=Nocardiopsis alba TaxID=53437 RepID=UPI0033A3E23F